MNEMNIQCGVLKSLIIEINILFFIKLRFILRAVQRHPTKTRLDIIYITILQKRGKITTSLISMSE